MDFSVKDDNSLTPEFSDLPQSKSSPFQELDLLPPLQPLNLQNLQMQLQQHLPPLLQLSAHLHEQQQSPVLPHPLSSPENGIDLLSDQRRSKKKTGGRKAGSQGYTKQDIGEVLDLIESHKPVGRDGWEQMAHAYNTYAVQNTRQEREPENLKKKYMSLVNCRKTQSDPDCPDDARRAKRINPSLDSGYDEDTDFEEESPRKRKPEPLEQPLRWRESPPFPPPPFIPPPLPPLPPPRQLNVYLSQLVQQIQQQQQLHQTQAQQQAQQLSMQILGQQQQHQAFMLNMMKLLMNSKPLMANSVGLPQQLLAILPTEWSVTATAAVNAAAASNAATATVEALKVEEWVNMMSSEALPENIKRGILDNIQALGVETLRDLLDIVETFRVHDLEELLGLNAGEVARLKKALEQQLLEPQDQLRRPPLDGFAVFPPTTPKMQAL